MHSVVFRKLRFPTKVTSIVLYLVITSVPAHAQRVPVAPEERSHAAMSPKSRAHAKGEPRCKLLMATAATLGTPREQTGRPN